MKYRVMIFVVSLLVPSGFLLTGQQPPLVAVFTAAQAEAGRATYDNTCGKCHTYKLAGRKGEEGELPPVSSLSAAYQKFVGNPNRVPPLAGDVFLSRWGQKSAAELIARFQITADDPFFQFEGLTDDAVVNLTAYVLKMNGGQAGSEPLTRTTSAVVNSVVK